MVIEPLSSRHDRSAFDCGEPSLNTYLRQYSRQNAEKGLGRTYVVVEARQPRVEGYYTISAGTVTFEQVPEKLPRYPIPVVHLGRLAVNMSAQGKGLGEFLLVDALKRAAVASRELGVYAVEVRALNDDARRFYLKYGFTPLLDDELHLYLPMKTIRKLKL
ncbi:MAG TPA: GNAT family N-acetyltransferase [Blastocatellia bacterium]|nr:GNAT family N-acetyltransferase [Blastocatellia bacterium]